MNDQGLIVIPRQEVPPIAAVATRGASRAHAVLSEYVPDDAQLALTSVHLEPGESLAAHGDRTVRIVVVTRGSGRWLGDSDRTFREGDVIVVPPTSRHLFVGAGLEGCCALSVEVAGQEGPNDTPDAARLTSEGARVPPRALGALLAFNDERAAEYEDGALFAFVDGSSVRDAGRRRRLLDAIRLWSDFDRRVVLLRALLSEDPELRALAEQLEHGTELAPDGGQTLRAAWDPVLELGASWFAWKTSTLDGPARTALANLVLEAGARAFQARARRALSPFGEDGHLGAYDDDDVVDVEMALAPLEDLDDARYAHLTTVVREGWDMLTLVCDRMADLAMEDVTDA